MEWVVIALQESSFWAHNMCLGDWTGKECRFEITITEKIFQMIPKCASTKSAARYVWGEWYMVYGSRSECVGLVGAQAHERLRESLSKQMTGVHCNNGEKSKRSVKVE